MRREHHSRPPAEYVPYTFWHEADPAKTAVVQASLSNHRHELLIGNAKGIPVLQQHGGADDNVPAYHSRRMNQLITQADFGATYDELQGQGHWSDGVLTTPPLKDFYERFSGAGAQKGQVPGAFSVVAFDPEDTGSKFGVKVEQLTVPGRKGQVDARLDAVEGTASFRTSNVRCFSWSGGGSAWARTEIDGRVLGDEFGRAAGRMRRMCKNKRDAGSWELAATDGSPAAGARALGIASATLRTRGSFVVVSSSSGLDGIALQIARNMHQYFFADSSIVRQAGEAACEKEQGEREEEEERGNVIRVAAGDDVPRAEDGFAVVTGRRSVRIRDEEGRVREYAEAEHAGLAAVYLRPARDGRVELVVWGAVEANVALAARFVPTLTGVGQPDFMVLGRSCLWRGVGGALALGFFDHDWKVSKSSQLG